MCIRDRYVDSVQDLHQPDMILLPGTKSTIADLRWLRQSGLEAAVQKAAAAGALVFGVCGGYQMLGRSVADPEGVEAAAGTELAGLGLLPVETVFRGEKVQSQTRGVFGQVEGMLSGLTGLGYEGYEIHMGRSQEPVSYTHLDVYKRQASGRGAAAGEKDRPLRRNSGGGGGRLGGAIWVS